jgi:hypothetical protein
MENQSIEFHIKFLNLEVCKLFIRTRMQKLKFGRLVNYLRRFWRIHHSKTRFSEEKSWFSHSFWMHPVHSIKCRNLIKCWFLNICIRNLPSQRRISVHQIWPNPSFKHFNTLVCPVDTLLIIVRNLGSAMSVASRWQ